MGYSLRSKSKQRQHLAPLRLIKFEVIEKRIVPRPK